MASEWEVIDMQSLEQDGRTGDRSEIVGIFRCNLPHLHRLDNEKTKGEKTKRM